MKHGWFAENLGLAAGLPGWISVLIPAALVLAVLAIVAEPIAPMRPARPVAILLGAAPLLALLLRAPEPPFSGRLWRAAVLGAFTDRDPERQELLLVASEASTPGERALAYRMWHMYGPPRPRGAARLAYGSLISKTAQRGTQRSPRGMALFERWTRRKFASGSMVRPVRAAPRPPKS